MQPIRVFASFDPDRDADLHQRLMLQARRPDSPFEVSDWSGREVVSEPLGGESGLPARIEGVDVLLVLCGEQTDSCVGVSVELLTAQSLGKPYFLVWGRREQTCTRPVGARRDDGMYTWIWNLLVFQMGLEIRKGALRESPA